MHLIHLRWVSYLRSARSNVPQILFAAFFFFFFCESLLSVHCLTGVDLLNAQIQLKRDLNECEKQAFLQIVQFKELLIHFMFFYRTAYPDCSLVASCSDNTFL